MGIKVVWSDEDGQHRGRVVEFVVREGFGGSAVQAVVIDTSGAFWVLDLNQLQEES